MSVQIPSLKDLMKAGVHFGHQKSKWHPKMRQFIFAVKNNVHVIDLEKTQVEMEKALNFLGETVARGGTVLFLSTKKQAKSIVKEAAIDCGMPYIVSRWLGGTLTNASSVLNLVKKYRKLKADQESGALEKYTKKEQLNISREVKRLDEIVGGISSLDKIPDVLFIVDMKEEKTAVAEAISKKVPIVAICDTNVNPEKADYAIPGNDDATSSIKLLVNTVSVAIKDFKASKPATPTATPTPVKK